LADATAIPELHHLCLINTLNGFIFLVLVYSGCPEKEAIKWVFLVMYIVYVFELPLMLLWETFRGTPPD